jgi:PTS system nitrogen regulatory IIA component
MPIQIKDILKPEQTLLLNTENKHDTLQTMIDCIPDEDILSHHDEVSAGIFQREELMSTGIGLNIGIPHVRLACIKSLRMIAAVNKKDIKDYESLDGRPVRLLFMILAGEHQHAQHLKIMASLSTKMKSPLLRQSLIEAPNTETIYEIMTQETT